MERLRVLYPILDKQLPALRIVGTVLGQYHQIVDIPNVDFGLKLRQELPFNVRKKSTGNTPKLVLNGSISSQDI